MDYCTSAQLITRFGEQELIQLTDRDGSGVIDDTVLAQAIGEASSEIDSYLRSRYPLPLLSTTNELARVAGDMARYRLYDDRMIDIVETRYKQAVDWLKAISSGRASLPTDIIDVDDTTSLSSGISVVTPTTVLGQTFDAMAL